MGALDYFVSILRTIRVELLEKFILPGLRISYWKWVLGLALAAIVVTVLINVVRIGTVTYSMSSGRSNRPKKELPRRPRKPNPKPPKSPDKDKPKKF